MEQQSLQVVVFTSVLIVVAILIIAITLLTLFQKKKHRFILREKEQQKLFEDTLASSQIEIRESALQNIAWELHDNVGQMLSLSRLELNILLSSCNIENNKKKVKEISQLIGSSLDDIRSLSKTLNPDVIDNMGFIQSIQNDIDRFNRLQFIEAKLTVHGDEYDIHQQDVIILFRILQEFFSNTIKHAQATKIDVNIYYTTDYLTITVTDNGKGFNINKIKKGSGLINMKSRATLINTTLLFESDSKGTEIQLQYKNTKNEKQSNNSR
jgi:signal transduction histidine kinase